MPFRSKLLFSTLGLVFAVLALIYVQVDRAVSSDLLAQIDHRLEVQARATAERLVGATPEQRELVARQTARLGEARVTLVAPDGRVLVDSALEDRALAVLENHGGRPEVVDARREGFGRATRRSSTLGVSLRYVAMAMPDGLVVRLAAPTTELDTARAAVRSQLLLASVIALGVAAVVGWLLARATVRPLTRMTRMATQLARGRYEIDMPSLPRDEFGVLGRALAGLAERLDVRIRELRAERDRLASMLEGMIEGVLLFDADGRVFLANRAASRILDLDPQNVAAHTIAEVMRHPGARAALEQAVRDRRASELEIEALGPTRRSVSLNVRPLSGEGGGGAVAVLHDVTRLRRLETVRRDFVTNVSHELRTPVASIQGYAEALLDGAVEERETARKFLDVIHRNAQRLGRLVADLLKLSRLEARAPEQVKLSPVALREVADEVADTLAEAAAARQATLHVDVPEDLRARGERDGVAQMLLNLVDNALKYGRAAGGRIEVRARAHADHVTIEVADNGPGIEGRHLPRLFERFYRVDEARTSQPDAGTGLGLAIVSHLAMNMGGHVSVSSELGRGTTFAIQLPPA